MNKTLALVPGELVRNRIRILRGQKVLLDRDLAELYGVEVRTLNQAVRRNIERFPADFMFQITEEEVEILRSQFVILRSGHGEHGKHAKYLPVAFTEQGVAMLSTVLRSPRAIQVNIEIMRTFVRLRALVVAHRDLAQKLEVLEKKCDGRFKVVFEALRQVMPPPAVKRRKNGFRARGRD